MLWCITVKIYKVGENTSNQKYQIKLPIKNYGQYTFCSVKSCTVIKTKTKFDSGMKKRSQYREYLQRDRCIEKC